MRPPRALGPLCSCPPPRSHPRSTLAKGTSPDTEGKGLTLASPGVSSFLRDYYKFSGSCPSPVRLRSQARAWHQLCWVGGGLRGHQGSSRLPLARLTPIPWRQGNKRFGAQRDLSGPTTIGWGEGGKRGHTFPSTPPALLILRDTFTGGNSQRSEEGNG